MATPIPEEESLPSLSHLIDETAQALRKEARREIDAQPAQDQSLCHLIQTTAHMLRKQVGKRAIHPSRIDS